MQLRRALWETNKKGGWSLVALTAYISDHTNKLAEERDAVQ